MNFRDQDPTPRASNESWRFTPSLLENSFSFSNFGNAHPSYYTPTPGGSNPLFHNQAGDLHTPSIHLGQGLHTPLSMPSSGEAIPSGATMDMAGFQALQPHQFQHFNSFLQVQPPQQTYAPSSFVHQDTGYETMEHSGSPMGSDPSEGNVKSMDPNCQPVSPMGTTQRQLPVTTLMHPLPPSAEKFRFHSALNAPTAMIKQADEIPITYLNKGQAYSVAIADTNAIMPVNPGTKYRTFIRVSFEDDEQRQKPGVCWSLWKEGRGTNEAHQRGGKLQAVEYVEAGQPVESDGRRTRVDLESSSFDGFSVIWTPGLTGPPEVNIAVRFNFLSTDFSHSKGVKGIPVRLCAKTSLVTPDASPTVMDSKPDLCFCKVKLFRDHGAERKLSNDIAHVKKSIDKVKQQIAQAESGMKDFGKRRRSMGIVKNDASRAGKVQKHKRTWSISSASSAGDSGGRKGRMTLEEDLHFKLQTLQDMFTSTRPVSVLYLGGEPLDDPDLHPVAMPGDQSPVSQTDGHRAGVNWQARAGRESINDSIVSPSPSSLSLASQTSAIGPGPGWQNFDDFVTSDGSGRHQQTQASKVRKTDDQGELSGWIEALGVDPSYKPPVEQRPKPVACFYILNKSKPETEAYHRAVYLTARNVTEFKERIAAKWGLDHTRIRRILHIFGGALDTEVDDDVIEALKEGQDMTMEVAENKSPAPKREWAMSVDSVDRPEERQEELGGLTLRLTF